jgi:ribosomal protein S18 acetylase RimI-like enzyme
MAHTIVPAGREDAPAIAALHTESWRSAYRGLVPDAFLDGPVVEERLEYWLHRLSTDDEGPRHLLKAVQGNLMVGFVCVVRDADPEWGPLLDNLHVKPACKGLGIGRELLGAAREWTALVAPGRPMHLWVIEDNTNARRFYERLGGVVAERQIVDFTAGIATPALRYVWEALKC